MSRSTVGFVFILAGTGLLGCVAPRDHFRGGEAKPVDSDLPILRDRWGVYSRLVRPVRLVIRDRASYARFPLVDVAVDFSREMILVAGLGPVGSDGFAIRIVRVSQNGSRLAVKTEVVRPEADEAAAPVRASPYHLVVVPRSDLNVVGFESRVDAGLLSGR